MLTEGREATLVRRLAIPLPGKECTADLKLPTRTQIYTIGALFRQREGTSKNGEILSENLEKTATSPLNLARNQVVHIPKIDLALVPAHREVNRLA